MKVVLLCNTVPPEIDGVGDYSFHLAAAFAGAGVAVELICRRQNQISALPDVPVQPLIEHWSRKDQKKVLEQLELSRPDWVGIQYVPYGFNHWGMPGFLPPLVREIKNLGIRVFVMFHEVSVRIHDLQSLLIGCRQKRIARQLCRLADALFTSVPMYARLLGRYEAHVRVVPIGANMLGKRLTESERMALRRCFMPDADLLICTFGNREPELLLSALRLLLPDFPNLHLLVLGHNTRRNEYKAEPFVTFLGPLPPDEISAILQTGDLFVLPDPVSPGGHGGTSNKSGALAAACAAGQAIIGTRGNLNNDLLQHGENIILSDGRDSALLARDIRALLDSSELRKRLQQNSRKVYENHLRWELITQDYLETLDQA